jgi:hypothetical protein
MEDIVAARVRDNSGKWYGFMTWGRIVDRIDDAWVEEIVLANARQCAIPEVVEVRVCDSLSEVATCRYFYEGLFHFANAGIPLGTSYEACLKIGSRSSSKAQPAYIFSEQNPSKRRPAKNEDAEYLGRVILYAGGIRRGLACPR